MKSLLLSLLLLLPSGEPKPLEVKILNPLAGEPAYGEVEIAAQVEGGEPVAKVEFYADGALVGLLTAPPYRLKADLGYDNRSHTLRVVAISAGGGRQEAILRTPTVNVDMELNVQLQQLYVTATRGGRRSLDLEREDFEVFDGGKRQQLVTFERGDVPLTAALLLDASESMQGGRLAKALEGVRTFVEGLHELDQATVILFSDQLVRATPFSSQPDVLLKALSDVQARGGSAVNDHLYLALKRLEGEPGRPVVILFSDGADVHSVLPMKQVLWKLARSQALVYWVRLEEPTRSGGDTISSAWRDGDGNKREARQLLEAVEKSGGQVVPIATVEELPKAFADILGELRSQYVLGYYPDELKGDGRWHRVEVNVRAAGVALRHRGGYVDQ